MVERLQVKACSIGKILTSLEKKYHSTHDKDGGMKKSPSGHSLGHRRQQMIQRIPAFNPNRIRKSPSSEAAAAVATDAAAAIDVVAALTTDVSGETSVEAAGAQEVSARLREDLAPLVVVEAEISLRRHPRPSEEDP